MNEDVIRLLRIVKGCKQLEVADALGINQNTYSRLERNPKKVTMAQAKKLGKFYNIGLENLLSDKIPVISFGETHNNNQESDYIALLKEQRNFLKKQNEELLKLATELKKGLK